MPQNERIEIEQYIICLSEEIREQRCYITKQAAILLKSTEDKSIFDEEENTLQLNMHTISYYTMILGRFTDKILKKTHVLTGSKLEIY